MFANPVGIRYPRIEPDTEKRNLLYADARIVFALNVDALAAFCISSPSQAQPPTATPTSVFHGHAAPSLAYRITNVTNEGFTIDWAAYPGAVSYKFRAYANRHETVTTRHTQHTFRNLKSGQTYGFWLIAENRHGFKINDRYFHVTINGTTPAIKQGTEPLTFLRVRADIDGIPDEDGKPRPEYKAETSTDCTDLGRSLYMEWDGPIQTGHYEFSISPYKDVLGKISRASWVYYENDARVFNLPCAAQYDITLTWKPGPDSSYPEKTIHRSIVVAATPTPAPAATNTPDPSFPDALTSITTSNITNTSVDIDWDGPTLNRDQYNYVVEVRAGSEGRGLNTVHSQATLSDLTPGTTYTGVVRIDAPRSNHWG